MNTIIFPHTQGPIFPEAVPVELEHMNSSKSTKELQPFDILQSPFHDLSPDDLLEELWEEGVDRKFKPLSYWPKHRGNYVRSYVLSNLRIQAKSTRLKVRWNLESMWDILPVELIISIFQFLHPIDLYHAVRSTKGLRSFLLNKNSSTIWRESFLNHPDIPFYPPDVSAPKWASLIFGPATCDICGSKNSLVDYTLRLRNCNTCMDYVYDEDEDDDDDDDVTNTIQPIIGEFPDELDHIWGLVAKVYRFSSFDYNPHHNQLEAQYSLKEITERAHEICKYLLDIRSCAPDAQTNYQTFLSVTRAAIQERMKQAKSCDLWAVDISTRSEAAFIGSVPAFCVKSEKALLKQGHDPRDVKRAQQVFKSLMIQSSYANLSDPVLSGSKLWKYLPQLDLFVDDFRRSRLSDELTQRISVRQGIIRTFYRKTIKILVTPEQRPYLPNLEKLYKLQFFADYINDPNESVGELDTESSRHQISRFIPMFWATKKRRLLDVLLDRGLLPKEATRDSNPEDFLGLAIAVFECCQNSVFVGWEDVGIHFSCPHWAFFSSDADSAAFIHFSDIGHQALKNLAELLHLDLRSALARDLDALNKRFICKNCTFYRQAGLHGHHTMTWRECLTHAVKMRSESSGDPHHIVFDVLSKAMTTSILSLEQPFPLPADPKWTCKHCYIYFDLLRVEAIAHAKAVHAITKPVESVDFLYCRTENSPKRSPLFIGLDEPSNHRCLRCRSHKGLRLWKKTPDLFRHILDKHAIQSCPVEGVDWIKIKAVADDTWIEEKMRARGITLA